MAKTISKLNILVSLSSKGLTSGVSEIAGSISGLAGKFGPAALAIAGFVGVATTLKSALNSLADAFRRVDESLDVSRNLDITISSLEALKLAAEQTGSTSDKMVGALTEMTRRISEAGMGSEESAAALKELGLSAERLSGLSSDRAMIAIAKALDQISNHGDKARLAYDLFGRQGKTLLTTLDELAKNGLDPFRDKIRELGVLSQSDAMGIEAMRDSWLELKLAMQGVWNQVAASVAPVLKDLITEVLIPMAKATIEAAKAWRELFGGDAAKMTAAFDEGALAMRKSAEASGDWHERMKKIGKLSKGIAADRMTVGAVQAGTSEAINTVQTLILAGRDRAAEERMDRKKELELSGKRTDLLEELLRVEKSEARKPELKVTEHRILV